MVRMERNLRDRGCARRQARAYTQRTTDMEANKGRTGVWLLDTGKRGATPLRLTDGGPTPGRAEWSKDGKFNLLSVQSQRHQPGVAYQFERHRSRGNTPVPDSTQVTNLPLEVGSFHVSPKADRILVSVEVFLDCTDLPCTKKRLDASAHAAATGALHTQLFIRHWDSWSDGRRSQVFAMALSDNGVAQGTPVNLTGGIGDVPGKPFGGREDYAFSPDGTQVAFSVRGAAGEAWSTNLTSISSRGRQRPAQESHGRQQGMGRTAGFLSGRFATGVRGNGSAGIEADRFHLVLLNLQSGAARALTQNWIARSNSFAWSATARPCLRPPIIWASAAVAHRCRSAGTAITNDRRSQTGVLAVARPSQSC